MAGPLPPPPATSNVGGGSRIRALRAPCVRAARRSSAHGVAASTLASLSDDSRHGAAPAAMRPALLSMAILDLILFCFSCLCPSQFIAPRFAMIFMASIVAVGLGLNVGGGRRGAGQQLGSICSGLEHLQLPCPPPAPSCSLLLALIVFDQMGIKVYIVLSPFNFAYTSLQLCFAYLLNSMFGREIDISR